MRVAVIVTLMLAGSERRGRGPRNVEAERRSSRAAWRVTSSIPIETRSDRASRVSGAHGRNAEGFKYSDAMIEAGKGGLVWTSRTSSNI